MQNIRQIADIIKLKAKAVMERDLAMLRAKRAEREKAAGLSRLPVSSEVQLAVENNCAKGATADTPDEHPSSVNELKIEACEDTNMADDAANTAPGLLAREEIPIDRAEAKTGLAEETMDFPEAFKAVPSAISKPQVRTPSDGFDVNSLDPHNTTQLSDVDFDSMFADSAVPNNNESLNFDLDFSTDAGISQDLLQDNTFADLTSNNDFTSASNENIDILMPGIENYVNEHTTGHVSDDFAMIDMPATSAAFDDPMPPKLVQDGEIDFTSIDAAADSGMMEGGPADSTFDDLFFDDSGDLGMGDGDISGDFGDFDDNWFKSDGQ